MLAATANAPMRGLAKRIGKAPALFSLLKIDARASLRRDFRHGPYERSLERRRQTTKLAAAHNENAVNIAMANHSELRIQHSSAYRCQKRELRHAVSWESGVRNGTARPFGKESQGPSYLLREEKDRGLSKRPVLRVACAPRGQRTLHAVAAWRRALVTSVTDHRPSLKRQ